MAIIFTKQKKTQRNLIIIFGLVVLIALIVLWQGFFKEKALVFPEEVFLTPVERPERDIEINFEIFDHPKIKEFLPFEEIEPFQEIPLTEDDPGQTKGRENPFVSY